MKNLFRIFVFFFITSIYIFPQDSDSLKNINLLEQEILAQEDTNLEIIMKSRNLILENLYTGNFEKIKQITEYLEREYKDADYIPIWYVERLLLSYCIRDYDYILDKLKLPEPENNTDEEKIYPPNDKLGLKLGEYLSNKYMMVKGEISSFSNINIEHQDFLILALDFLLYKFGQTPFVSQAGLNFESDTFLQTYPESEYEDFIRKNIRYVVKTSDWGLGIEAGLGGGILIGDLKSYFNSHPVLGFAFEGNYKNLFLTLNLDIGIGSSKNSFEYNGVWKDDLKLNFDMLKAAIGYNVFENESFRIIPFTGMGAMKIQPPEEVKKEAGNDVSLGFSALYSIGINTDYKFSPRYFPSILGTEQGTYYLRLRAGYNLPTFNSDDNRFNGGILFFQIIFGSFGKKAYRDY